MIKNGKHKITAITRADSTSKIPDGVLVKKVDYNDQSSLVEALKGQDALIITMGLRAPPDQQIKLFEAAAAADVPWVIPNEFGIDSLNEAVGKDIFVIEAKKKERDHIEKLGKSSWVGFVCGFWYEFSLGGSPNRFGFDFKNRTVRFFDDGTTHLNASTWPQTGRSVANVLGLKVLPDDENDKNLCLSHFRNKFVYTSSFKVNQKEMLDSVLRVTGASPSDWKVTHVPVKDFYQDSLKEFQSGNHAAFMKLMYSRMFFPDLPGDYEASRGLDNDKLGLPKENLDEFTKTTVDLVESGFFDAEY